MEVVKDLSIVSILPLFLCYVFFSFVIGDVAVTICAFPRPKSLTGSCLRSSGCCADLPSCMGRWKIGKHLGGDE